LWIGTGAILPYSGAWTATANDSFLHISPGSSSGAGNAFVVYTYDPFSGTETRTGTLTIAGQTITVTQAGTNYLGPTGSGPPVTLVSPGLNSPQGVAVDGTDNAYIADTGITRQMQTGAICAVVVDFQIAVLAIAHQHVPVR
jgi:trimeric autotransporter adhesin